LVAALSQAPAGIGPQVALGLPLTIAASCILICAVVNGPRVQVLELRPVVWMGAISYSIYIWHAHIFRVGLDVMPESQWLVRGVLLTTMALAVAGLSYGLVERPIRDRVRRRLEGGTLAEHSPEQNARQAVV
jgi:peptidoglycan/LPS O-acetylase OafA/YrhL